MEFNLNNLIAKRSTKEVYNDNGKTIKSTISGVAKDVGQKYFTEHGFDSLHDGLEIECSGKLTAHYNNDLPLKLCLDNTPSNVRYTLDFHKFLLRCTE